MSSMTDNKPVDDGGAAHTPGPWTMDSEFGTSIKGADGVTVAAVLNPINATKGQKPVPSDLNEVKANASLVVAAPDHAHICWAMCVAAGRWEPWGDGRGEFCINGMRYATKLDVFGCPVVNEPIRSAIARARQEQSR